MKDKRIAVCDDQEDVSALLRIIFEKRGGKVFLFSELHSIEPIADVTPDVILMDLKLPGMGGQKAIELMRENDRLRHVPVILISGNPLLEEISDALKIEYVSKPFQVKELLDLVSKYTS